MTSDRQRKYRDRNGNKVHLGEVVGQGGEAVVYEVQGKPNLLAKIYRATPSDYDLKLSWMIGHPPVQPGSHVVMAWPSELVYDKADALHGYLMPRVKSAVPLLVVFNPRKRAQLLPNFDLRYRYRAARNLAAAVQSAHDGGYVVGDLNESNALVASTALVSLLDTDSFQVRVPHRATTKLFRSPVGKPEYTAPELQGLNFRAVDRIPAHDRFALGVLIYQLLMDGNHPFRLLWHGSGEPPALEDSIRQGWFPYAVAPSIVAPPPRAPRLDSLDTSLSALVRRCFVDGHRNPNLRPAADEWQRALASAETALRVCSLGHIYAGHLTTCPECANLAGVTPALPLKKLRRPKKPKTKTPVLVNAPPPFGSSSHPPQVASPAPVLQPAVKAPKKKTNWPGWLAAIIVAILIRNALAGDGSTVPASSTVRSARVTATARARSTFVPRSPTPTGFAPQESLSNWGFTDPFLDSSVFESVRSDGVSAEISNDRFNLSVTTPDTFYWIDYSTFQISNRDFGASVNVEETGGSGEIFLTIHSLTSGDRWFFAAGPARATWLLYRDSPESDGPFVWIVPHDYSWFEELRNISVRVADGAPTFMVNGASVVTPYEMDMPQINGRLVVGFGVHSAPEIGSAMEAEFDDFRVFAIP